MKVVDLLKEQKLLKRKYFNNCACLIEPVYEYASEQEKSQARERIVKCHSETKKALERYNELADRLHISNANTYVEVMGYRLSVASALECLRSIKTNPLTLAFGSMPPPSTVVQHPITTYIDMMNVSGEHFDSENWIDPLHVIKSDQRPNTVIGEFELELECAITKSNCETEA